MSWSFALKVGMVLMWANSAFASGGTIPLGHVCLPAEKDPPPASALAGLDASCAGLPKLAPHPIQGTSCYPGPANNTYLKRSWYCMDDHAQCAYPGDPATTHRPYAGVKGGDDIGPYLCATSDSKLFHSSRAVGTWNPKYYEGTKILKPKPSAPTKAPAATACQKGSRADDTEHCNDETTVPVTGHF